MISGDDFEEQRGTLVAAFYGAEHERFAGLTHWDLVFSPAVQQKIAAFLQGW